MEKTVTSWKVEKFKKQSPRFINEDLGSEVTVNYHAGIAIYSAEAVLSGIGSLSSIRP